MTVLNFARNFQSVPVSLIGVTLATTSFPLLAAAAAENSIDQFWKTLKNSFLLIAAGSTAAAVLIFIIKEPLIKVFLGGGAFGAGDISRTAGALGVFCLNIPTESLVHLLSRAFYATKNTTIPVVVNIIGILITIPGGYLLSMQYGVIGIPLAFFAGTLAESLILSILLSRRLSHSRS